MVDGAAVSAISPGECAQVKPLDNFENEAGQVISRQQVVQRWQEQVVGLAVDRAKVAVLPAAVAFSR